MLDQDVNSTDEIGYYETTISTIMGSRNQCHTGQLKSDKSSGKRGEIIVRAEAVSESSHVVIF